MNTAKIVNREHKIHQTTILSINFLKIQIKKVLFKIKSLSLHPELYTKSDIIMATYTITLNERTSNGKALMEYLRALGILVQKVSPKAKSSYQRSKEDKLNGRVEKFSSSEEMFKSLGI